MLRLVWAERPERRKRCLVSLIKSVRVQGLVFRVEIEIGSNYFCSTVSKQRTEYIVLRTHQHQTLSPLFHLSLSISALHCWWKHRRCFISLIIFPTWCNMVKRSRVGSFCLTRLSVQLLYIYFTMTPGCTRENIMPFPRRGGAEGRGLHHHCAFFCLWPETPPLPLL